MPFPPRSLDGGIDEITLLAGVTAGRLSLCGKHVVGPDPEAAITRAEASVVVCLNEAHELSDRYPEYVAWLRANSGARAVWVPIPDLHAPPAEGMELLVDDIVMRLNDGEHVLVHCGAGLGRAGTTAVAVLLRFGQPLDESLAHVRACRPLAGPEAGVQHDLVASLAERWLDGQGIR